MKGGRERLRAFWAGVLTLSLVYFAATPFLGPGLAAGILFGFGLWGIFTLSSKEGVMRQAAFLSRLFGRAGPAKPVTPQERGAPGSPDLPSSRAPLRSGADSGTKCQAEVRGMRFPGEPEPLGAAGVGGREPGPPPGPGVR